MKKQDIAELKAVLCVIMREDCSCLRVEDDDNRKLRLPRKIQEIIESAIENCYFPIFAKRLYDYGYRRDYEKDIRS